MTFKEFVEERIMCDPEDQEPFCPFATPNCMGYCDVAYSEHCYSCEEALGEYVMKTYGCGDYLFERVDRRFDYSKGMTPDECLEATEDCLNNLEKWEAEAHENLAE